MLYPEDQWADLPKTRKEAIEAEAMAYFTGKPCIHGHVTPRWAVSKNCMGCVHAKKAEKAAYDKEYRGKNGEALRTKQAKYRAENPELIAAGKKRCEERKPEKYKAVSREYYAANKTRLTGYHREYYAANASEISVKNTARWHANGDANRAKGRAWKRENNDKVNANIAKRRADKKNATPAWADLKAIAALYTEAKRLDETTGIKHHVDHIFPLNGKLVSGLHVENNLRVITAEENLLKNNKLLPEFANA